MRLPIPKRLPVSQQVSQQLNPVPGHLLSMVRTSSRSRITLYSALTLGSLIAFSNLAMTASAEDTPASPESGKKQSAYSMTIKTYGEGTPKGDNLSEDELQKNRRVDVTIDTAQEPVVSRSSSASVRGVIWATTDPADLTRQLELTVASRVSVIDGQLPNPVSINLFSNYTAFMKRWEILVYAENNLQRGNPLATISGENFQQEARIEWDGMLDNNERIATGDNYLLVLRQYDNKGRIDETFPVRLEVKGPDRNVETEENPSIGQLALQQRQQRNTLARQEIVIRGSRVRIYGRDLGSPRVVSINGENVTLDDNDQFVTEYLLPDGEHEFAVLLTQDDGSSHTTTIATELDDKYLFATALADLTIGENTVSGNIETLEVDESNYYGGDIFVDGRLAFYLKGKIKGKYLVTAQLDTGHDDVDKLFDNLHSKDTESIFRRLDPDDYYPVYGDDSTLIDDTDSQGKLYVRVDWDHSSSTWGNFNTGITGTEFSQFNRSLYGFQLKRRSNTFTNNGEHRTDLTVFASEAQSAHRHNEFRATGGSLYYLRDRDIVRGSEKIWVEIRSRETSRVIERIELTAGQDYRIDDFQGRILLNRPLQSVDRQSAPSIIRDLPLDGNTVWLIADYEYVPDDFNPNDVTVGARIKHWLADKLAIGGTWIQEQRDDEEHSLQGLDATLRLENDGFVKAEVSRSRLSQTRGSFTSEDGGLLFTEFQSTSSAGSSLGGTAASTTSDGMAYGLTAGADFQQWFGLSSETRAEAWVKFRESGFAASGFDSGHDTTDAGFEATRMFGKRFSLTTRATLFERDQFDSRITGSLQAEYDVNESLSVAAELRQIEEEDKTTGFNGSGTIAAVRAGVDLTNRLNVYASAQGTVSSSGTYESNDRVSLGLKTRQTDKLDFNAEVSTGERGDSFLAGADFRLSQDYSLYANHEISTDSTQSVRQTATIGQRRKLDDKTRIYTEHQFADSDERAGLGHTFGIDYKFNEYVNSNASFQLSDYTDAADEIVKREALSFGLDYKKNRSTGSSRLEFRRDKSPSIDNEQWVLTNNLRYRHSSSLRWQARLNHSHTEDKANNITDATFTEAGIGFALRPVTHDKLNVLGRLTALYDLPPDSQSTQTDERSVTGSTEFSYQLNQLWEIGGKGAYKRAEIRTARDNGGWNNNDLILTAIRARYHLLFRWDALGEYHWLHSRASKDTQHGTLFALGRNVGNHLNLSVGYNFTRFDDNLLNDEADVKGWFVNLVGKY